MRGMLTGGGVSKNFVCNTARTSPTGRQSSGRYNPVGHTSQETFITFEGEIEAIVYDQHASGSGNGH
jgi:hypothetical protein